MVTEGSNPSIGAVFRIVSSFFVSFRLWSFLDSDKGESDFLSATSPHPDKVSDWSVFQGTAALISSGRRIFAHRASCPTCTSNRRANGRTGATSS